jgi:hypothetical protein
MKDISDAADLIATARDALLNDLLPRLPKDQRYTGLMIANAMAIALREQRSSADAMRDESGRLHKLLASIDFRDQESGGGEVWRAWCATTPALRSHSRGAFRRWFTLACARRESCAYGSRLVSHLESQSIADEPGGRLNVCAIFQPLETM